MSHPPYVRRCGSIGPIGYHCLEYCSKKLVIHVHVFAEGS
jgi:hypothetical protein